MFNGGKSRYDAFQMKYEWRHGRRRQRPQLADAVEGARTTRAGALENQNGNFPAPQDINNLAADYGVSGYNQPYNSTTSFVWSLPFGKGKRWGGNMSTAMDLLVGGWQLAGINTDHARRDGDVHLLAGRGVPGVGHHQRLLRREQLPAEHHVRSVRAGGPAVDHQLVQHRVRRRCRPIRASRSATRRATTSADRTSGSSISRRARTFAVGDRAKLQFRARGVQPVQPRQLHCAPAANRSAATFGTITTTYDARQVQLGLKVLW